MMMNSANELNVDIVEYPARHLVGFRTRSNVSRSSMDCPPLWEELRANMHKFPGRTKNETFGLFLMIDDFITFDFWVAVSMPLDFPTPRDMEVFELAAGCYARCLVPNSSIILMAYSTLYSTWFHDQDEYDIVKYGPCFELYPPRWKQDEAFGLYVRVSPRKYRPPH